MQMMVQQSVRFHNPNSPGAVANPNLSLADFPFTPGMCEDSQEVTSQSEDEDGLPNAPSSPVNITPSAPPAVTSYGSMPLFPDQQAPVPINEAVANPDQGTY